MKIAIIGGSGFIGSYTYVELIKQGFNDVTIIDINYPYSSVLSRETPKFIKCDITDRKEIQSCLKRERFEYIYLLAGIIRAEQVRDNPLRSYDINIGGLVNILDSIRDQTNFKKIIYSSTTHLYHRVNDVVCDNTPVVNDDMHLYPGGKFCAETIIKGYQKLYNIPYIIFRYSVAYGVAGHADNVMHRFVYNALHDRDLTIYSNGNIWRDFLYVSDHAKGNVAGIVNQHVNNITILLGGKCIDLKSLAFQIVRSASTSKSKIILTDFNRVGDHLGFKQTKSTNAMKFLNWEPTIDIPTGIDLLINSFKNINN